MTPYDPHTGSRGSFTPSFYISLLFSMVVVSIYISTISARGFLFFTYSPAFIVCRFSAGGHSDGASNSLEHQSTALTFSLSRKSSKMKVPRVEQLPNCAVDGGLGTEDE